MFISAGGYVEALMILMLMMNNFTNDHLCGGYGGVDKPARLTIVPDCQIRYKK